MYKLSEEQRGSLLYIFEHLTVTGPDQAALLSNAAVIVRGLENEEEEEETAASAAEEKKADQETPKTESAPASFYSNLPQEVSKKYLKQGGFYEWCYETVRSMYDHSKGVQRY